MIDLAHEFEGITEDTGIASIGVSTVQRIGNKRFPQFDLDWLADPDKYQQEWKLWARITGIPDDNLDRILALVKE